MMSETCPLEDPVTNFRELILVGNVGKGLGPTVSVFYYPKIGKFLLTLMEFQLLKLDVDTCADTLLPSAPQVGVNTPQIPMHAYCSLNNTNSAKTSQE